MNQKNSELKTIVKMLYDFQKMRIATGNQIKIKKTGEDQKIPDEQVDTWQISDKGRELFNEIYDDFSTQEKKLISYISKELKNYPIYTQFLKKVKGVGPLMAAVIISEYDIHRADTVSKLWSYTGLAPGKDKLVKGQKATFNTFLKAKMCGVLGASFLKSNSPYRKFYDNMKNRRENQEGWKDKTPAHRHADATRYMIKMFLKDLYVAWREIEGLPVRPPYQEEYLGHKHSGE